MFVAPERYALAAPDQILQNYGQDTIPLRNDVKLKGKRIFVNKMYGLGKLAGLS
jgi:hypothetical protein